MSQLVLADEIFAKESVLKIDTEAIAHNFKRPRKRLLPSLRKTATVWA